MYIFSMKVFISKMIFSNHLMIEFVIPLQSEIKLNKQSENKTVLAIAVSTLRVSSKRLVL